MIGELLDMFVLLVQKFLHFVQSFKSMTTFYPEPYSQCTLLQEFGSVDFQCLPQIVIRKINPHIDAFCARYFYFIRTTQYTGQNCGTTIYSL
jgi:hypothetical protein